MSEIIKIKSVEEALLILVGLTKHVEEWNQVPADDKELIHQRMLLTIEALMDFAKPLLNPARNELNAAISIIDSAKELEQLIKRLQF